MTLVMQYGTGSYDDYGFLSAKGLVFTTPHGSQPSFRSVEDLLAHSNGIIKNQSCATRSQISRDESLQTGCISKKMSSSQPNLRKCKANDNWSIKVRFDTENDQTDAPTNIKRCERNSRKTKNRVKETAEANCDDEKSKSWWKSLFSTKKRHESKLSNGQGKHSKRLHSVKNEPDDLLKRVIEDKAGIRPQSSCVKSETLPNQQFQILEFTKSPCLHKRVTEDGLNEIDANNCLDKGVHDPRKNSTLATKQHTLTRRRSSKGKKKSAKSAALTQNSTNSTNMSPNTTSNKHSSLKNGKKENVTNHVLENMASLDLEKSSKHAIQQTGKYRVHRPKEKKVLVHIQTKEEMPIKNGIPQWRSLSYQCIPRSVNLEAKSQRTAMQILESSFIGECKENTETEIATRKKVDVPDGTMNPSKSRADTVTVSSIHNVDLRDDMKGDTRAFETSKKVTSIDSAPSKTVPKAEIIHQLRLGNVEQQKPSYFEVTAEINVANESVDLTDATSKQIEDPFVSSRNIHDKVPEIIARKHPYLMSSSPLRHLAKCLRNAPSNTKVKPISQLRNSDTKRTNDIDNNTPATSDAKVNEASILSKNSEAESTDSFAILLGVAQQAAQKQLLCSQRCFSDSDLSATGFLMKTRSTKIKEPKETTDMPAAEANCVTERLSQTQQILARMRERVSRLEVLSDGGEKELISKPGVVAAGVHHVPVQVSKSINAHDDISITNMSALPLPVISRSNSMDFDNAGVGLCDPNHTATPLSVEHPFIGSQTNTNHPAEVDAIQAFKPESSSKYFDHTHNGCSISVNTASMEKIYGVNKSTSSVSHALNAMAIANTQLGVSPASRNTEIAVKDPAFKDEAGGSINVSSPTRRRLRIIPFTLPLPKSSKYSDDEFFATVEEVAVASSPYPTTPKYTSNDDQSNFLPVPEEMLQEDNYQSSNERMSHRSSPYSMLESDICKGVESADEIDNCGLHQKLENYSDYSDYGQSAYDSDSTHGKHSYKELEHMLVQQDRVRETIMQEMQAIIKSRKLTLDQRVISEKLRHHTNYSEESGIRLRESQGSMRNSSQTSWNDMTETTAYSSAAEHKKYANEMSKISPNYGVQTNLSTRSIPSTYSSSCDLATSTSTSAISDQVLPKRISASNIYFAKNETHSPHDSDRDSSDRSKMSRNCVRKDSCPADSKQQSNGTCDRLSITSNTRYGRDVGLSRGRDSKRKGGMHMPAPLFTYTDGNEEERPLNMRQANSTTLSKPAVRRKVHTSTTDIQRDYRNSDDMKESNIHGHKDHGIASTSHVASTYECHSAPSPITSTPCGMNESNFQTQGGNRDSEFHKYWGFVHKKHSKIYISGLSYVCDDYETDL